MKRFHMKSNEKKPKKTPKRLKGDIGEEVTVKYLENKGYIVKERNYWKPWGEIDIVATKAGVYRFVEVKTAKVTREIAIRPEENFHPAKLHKLHRVIQTYLLQHKVQESVPWQIDLACVYLNLETKRAKVDLFENIIL